MTIGPILEGGLKLVPEGEHEWQVLYAIAGESNGNLARELGGLMDEDSMWEEIVVPELEEDFSGQRTLVLKTVRKARSKDGEVVIKRAHADQWYGALNQARFALEEEFSFSEKDYQEEDEIEDPIVRSAFLRKEFYETLQMLLMRYAMPEGDD